MILALSIRPFSERGLYLCYESLAAMLIAPARPALLAEPVLPAGAGVLVRALLVLSVVDACVLVLLYDLYLPIYLII